jgi:hypothetical protein
VADLEKLVFCKILNRLKDRATFELLSLLSNAKYGVIVIVTALYNTRVWKHLDIEDILG